jgi:transposase-like protein
MSKRRKRHSPEQIVKKLRDAEAMLNAGKDLAAVLQSLEVCEATYHRWRNQYGGMKSEEAKRLKELEDENRRLKQLVADLSQAENQGGWGFHECLSSATGDTSGPRLVLGLRLRSDGERDDLEVALDH